SSIQAQQATLNALAQCLRQRQPAFCLLMSSLASEVSGLGQAAYAAACLYQDAFAHLQTHTGSYPWLVINWDVWQTADQATSVHAALAAMAMTPAEGAQAFRRMLAQDGWTRLAVATSDPRTRAAALRARTQRAQADPGGPALTGRHARPDLPTAYEPPRSADEATMAALWEELLGIDTIGIHDNFFDLGGHSLLGTQLLSRLQQTFQVALGLEVFFEAPTIASLTEALLHKRLSQEDGDQLARVIDQLEAMSEEEAQALRDRGPPPAALLAALASATPATPPAPPGLPQPHGPVQALSFDPEHVLPLVLQPMAAVDVVAWVQDNA